MIDLSIILVNFNTKDLTLQCIESIKNEGSFLKKEVIVVDNNSDDGSVQALQKLENSKTRKLQVIENRKNLGFSKAVNQGVKRAKGKYILLLNSDCQLRKGSLKKLLKFAGKTSDAGVVGAKLLNPNKTLQASCFNFPTIGKAIQQYWLGKKNLLDKYAPNTGHRIPITVDAVVGAAFLMTPKALKNVGLLDERYFMYFEDIDYCRRVWKSGLKVYYLPSAKVIHYHGASGGKSDLLVESSKIYHGVLKHILFNFIIWSGQKWQRLFKN